MRLDFQYGLRRMKTTNAKRKPLYELKDIAEFLKIEHQVLVSSFGHYEDRPKPKIVALPKRYYDRDEVVKWFKEHGEVAKQVVLKKQKLVEIRVKKAERIINSQSDLSAARIADEIRKAKLTQKDLAQMVGVNPSAISQWIQVNLKHRTRPSSASFNSLSEIFGVEIDYLLATDWKKP